MSVFFDRFKPDPEFPEIQRVWTTGKPLMRDCVVAYAPFYPEYPGLEVGESVGSPKDPGSPWARVADDTVDVVIYSHGSTADPVREWAWNFILEHPQTVEASLRRKLFALHLRFLEQLHEEVLPIGEEYVEAWQAMEPRLKWDDPSAVDQLFKLAAVSLADSGLDECGFSSFEFQTGWDRDHGVGVLMHKDRVLASGGMTELIVGGDIVGAVRSVQEYELDEGDLSLLEPGA